jgi:hypothetical protein
VSDCDQLAGSILFKTKTTSHAPDYDTRDTLSATSWHHPVQEKDNGVTLGSSHRRVGRQSGWRLELVGREGNIVWRHSRQI